MAESERNDRPSEPVEPTGQSGDSAEAMLDLLRRERADFLNYKRRVERERANERESARAEVLQRLLTVLDDLDRALEQIPPDLERHPWAQGTALGRQRLREAFSKLGVERIGVEGEPFDPARYEAHFYDERPDATDQRVGAVLEPGYRLGDRLLRPARVTVVGPVRGTAGAVPHANEAVPHANEDDTRAGARSGRSARDQQNEHTDRRAHDDVRAGG